MIEFTKIATNQILFFFFCLLILSAIVYFVNNLLKKKCPKCGKLNAGIIVHTTTQRRKQIWNEQQNTFQTEKIPGQNIFGSKDFIETTVTEFYKCKYCTHKWNRSYITKESLDGKNPFHFDSD